MEWMELGTDGPTVEGTVDDVVEAGLFYWMMESWQRSF